MRPRIHAQKLEQLCIHHFDYSIQRSTGLALGGPEVNYSGGLGSRGPLPHPFRTPGSHLQTIPTNGTHRHGRREVFEGSQNKDNNGLPIRILFTSDPGQIKT
jgi:hypothetical protein